MTSGKAVLSGERTMRFLTTYVTGPVHAVASPMPFAGVPLLHSLILNSVARSGARCVRQVISEGAMRLLRAGMIVYCCFVLTDAIAQKRYSDASWQWVEQYYGLVLDKVLPICQSEDWRTVACFRYSDSQDLDTKEYAFTIQHGGLGEKEKYIVILREPQGPSVKESLLNLATKHYKLTLRKATKEIRITETKYNSEQCQEIDTLVDELLRAKYDSPNPEDIVMDPPTFQLSVRSYMATIDITTHDSSSYVAHWAEKVIKSLSACNKKSVGPA
jgi:hypothetical protein